ncbi:hypothetical protein MMC30_008412 [Trapelia coarctata]|nr:hypothetical protein [Trapelia coarctata]
MRAFSPFRSQFQSQHPLLPLHNPPSPTTSVLLSPPISVTPTSDPDTLLALSRQTAHLQKTLQTLLDAQSAGLLAGLAPSDGSHTPTASSHSVSGSSKNGDGYGHTSGEVGGKQDPTQSYYTARSTLSASHVEPKRTTRKISLHAARAGILRSLHELATVKEQESAIFSSEIDLRTHILDGITAAEAKKEGIRDTIMAIESDPNTGRSTITALEREEKAVEGDIVATENRLMELKARLGTVKQIREERANKLEARLSSWQAALGEVERGAAERWLDSGGRARKGTGVYALPRQRRTLQMVREEVEGAKVEVAGRREGVERERVACVEGAKVWDQVCRTVGEVEKRLRVEVGKDKSREAGSGAESGGMESILEHLDTAVSTLSAQLSIAESKDWKLLVCSIGAELEALQEGKEMLEAALIQSGMLGSTGGVTVRAAERGGRNGVAMAREDIGGVPRSEDEDDEPGPELLISHLED